MLYTYRKPGYCPPPPPMERHPYLARIKFCEQKFNITGYFYTLPPSIHCHSRYIATKFAEQTELTLWQSCLQCFDRQSEFPPWCCYCSAVALWCAPVHHHTDQASTKMKMCFVMLLLGCCISSFWMHALLQSLFQEKKTRVAIVILLLKYCTTMVPIFPGLSPV
jgi:hypothetical protein